MTIGTNAAPRAGAKPNRQQRRQASRQARKATPKAHGRNDAAKGPDHGVARDLKRAHELHLAEDFEAANELYQRVLARQPENHDAMLWLGVLAVADQLAPYRYDGLRHFLPALPAVAILVAVGGEWLGDALALRVGDGASPYRHAVTANAPAAICAAIAAAQIVSTHPYQSAYRNAAANAISVQHSEEWIEAEYWGQAYQDGGRWLDANTERDAIVYLPIGEKIAGYYARRPRGVWGQLEARFENKARPQYVMFITRLGFYDEAIRWLEAKYQPVYSVQVQNATLLKIYGNRQTPSELSGEPGRG